MSSTAAPTYTPAVWFAFLIKELLVRLGFAWKHGVSIAVQTMIWRRARRLGQRFARLAALIEAGKVPVVRPRAARVATETPAVRKPRPAALTSVRNGWVTLAIPECSWVGGTLEHFLYGVPEIAAYHALAPVQVGRIMRPMCRMFGVKPPPWLALPKRVRKKRPPPVPFDAHPEMWRWPHISMTARFGTKRRRKLDKDLEALEEARKKREEGG